MDRTAGQAHTESSTLPVDCRYTLSDLPQRKALVDVIRFFYQQGWTPATSSNFSYRVPGETQGFYVSVSGIDKGQITPADFIPVDMCGKSQEASDASRKPSAETLLHAVVYQQFPQVNTVVHVHSVNSTVVSKLYEAEGKIALADFEILKGLEGICTHESRVVLPVFPNSQDMSALSKTVAAYLQTHTDPCYGFLLAGHGLYTWGADPAQAKRHAEVLEFLFDCVLKLKPYGDFNCS